MWFGRYHCLLLFELLKISQRTTSCSPNKNKVPEPYLRAADCKYRELAHESEKSDFRIFGQDNPLVNYYRWIQLSFPKNFTLWEIWQNTKKYPKFTSTLQFLSTRVQQIGRSQRVDLFLINSYSFWQLENAKIVPKL